MPSPIRCHRPKQPIASFHLNWESGRMCVKDAVGALTSALNRHLRPNGALSILCGAPTGEFIAAVDEDVVMSLIRERAKKKDQHGKPADPEAVEWCHSHLMSFNRKNEINDDSRENKHRDLCCH